MTDAERRAAFEAAARADEAERTGALFVQLPATRAPYQMADIAVTASPWSRAAPWILGFLLFTALRK